MISQQILIASSEPKMSSLLRQVLTGDGYAVIAAVKGEQAVQLTAKDQPSMVVLSMQLVGDMDGFEVVRRIREFSDVPVILLTANQQSEDILRGYNMGADDIVITPFDPRILLARIRALLKRSQGRVNAPAEIVVSDVVIDIAAHRVTRKGDEIILSDTEYNLLLELARHRNRVMMHDQLLTAVWGREYRNEVGYLRSYIHILRRKLENDPSQPRLIISRPGIGYMLTTAPGENSGD